ncbi:hypothetical protein O181_011156 [Austropuccinia psidii MF-1]|uniref:Uncharacterized protein n=1 Tax=Austropuccinia psidii MF-1 TaxID=1389203 RepID=A0A9Q3BV90_9BASI|nr:hypothetical protein [Austropuccinia psidii MF-1]
MMEQPNLPPKKQEITVIEESKGEKATAIAQIEEWGNWKPVTAMETGRALPFITNRKSSNTSSARGFMEDSPNTVSNLNTSQYRKNPKKGFSKYRPALNTGSNTCIDSNDCIGSTNTGSQ